MASAPIPAAHATPRTSVFTDAPPYHESDLIVGGWLRQHVPRRYRPWRCASHLACEPPRNGVPAPIDRDGRLDSSAGLQRGLPPFRRVGLRVRAILRIGLGLVEAMGSFSVRPGERWEGDGSSRWANRRVRANALVSLWGPKHNLRSSWSKVTADSSQSCIRGSRQARVDRAR